jgi:hypothetical protein
VRGEKWELGIRNWELGDEGVERMERVEKDSRSGKREAGSEQRDYKRITLRGLPENFFAFLTIMFYTLFSFLTKGFSDEKSIVSDFSTFKISDSLRFQFVLEISSSRNDFG